MPINVGTSPAIVFNNGNTKTTASFTAPSECILVACVSTETNATSAITNSGTGLTWTKRREQVPGGGPVGYAAVFTAPLVTGRSLTVTSTFSGGASDEGALKVYSFTGVDLANPVGQSGNGFNNTLPSYTPTLYTSSVANSRAVGVTTNFSSSTVSIGSGYTGHAYEINPLVSGAAFYANADTFAPGPVSVTMSASSASWAWVGVELLPAGASGFTGWGLPIK